MFRLAHISDIHLGPLPDVSYRELVSKRITGYINWQRNRRRMLHAGVTDAILQGIGADAADHLAVTGDLVNLALDAEIELARQWLDMLGSPGAVSLVPGNHDAYVPGALARACRLWHPWMTTDAAEIPSDANGFPYMRIRGDVALIGVSSARATAPFMATGRFGARQAARLARLLDLAAARGLFRVVMIHHPPVRGAAAAHKRLYGISLFQRVVRTHGAGIVLHGHTHLPTLHWIDGRDGPVPVVGVAAAGQGFGGHRPAAQYNLIDIDGAPGAWSVRLARRGIVGQSLAIATIETVDLSNGVRESADGAFAAYPAAK